MADEKTPDSNEKKSTVENSDAAVDKKEVPEASDAEQIMAEDAAMLESIEKEVKQDIADLSTELKTQLDSLNGKYMRVMAEFDNYKRRSARDYEKLVASANEKLLLQMIEVRENFERALAAQAKAPDAATFADGVKLIYTKLRQFSRPAGSRRLGQLATSSIRSITTG